MTAHVLDAAFPRWLDQLDTLPILGVMRYVSWLPNGKVIGKAEFDATLAAGKAVGIVWESTGTDYVGGYDAGHRAGLEARRQAHALGFPDSRPIYTTVDRGDHWSDVLGEYQRGFNDAAGQQGAPQGFYGDVELGHRLLDLGLIAWFWQTNARAWPGDSIDSPRAALIQRTSKSHPSLPASSYDENDVFALDWGQFPAPAPPSPPEPPTGTTTSYTEASVPEQTDIRIPKLDEHGNGHVKLAPPLTPTKLTAGRVHSLFHLAVRPPESAGRYDPIPRLSLTIGPDHLGEVVVEGGLPGGACTFRVTWT